MSFARVAAEIVSEITGVPAFALSPGAPPESRAAVRRVAVAFFHRFASFLSSLFKISPARAAFCRLPGLRFPLLLNVLRVLKSKALSCKHEQLSGFDPLMLANFCACGHFFLGNHESQLAVLILSAEDHSLGKNACQFGGFEVYKNHYLLADHLLR